MTISPGTKLGRYEIRAKIGEGGMGEVYLAQDTKLDRKVALKILPAEVADDRGWMNRFVQEAKAASALNHPNIITIYEIEQIDSIHLIAIEFIDGKTLRQRLRDAPIKLGEVLDVSTQIAAALSAAHAAGIVHRDIKPENIMLRRDGIVKVLDFGLAKLTARLASDSVDPEALTRAAVNTEPGLIIGTAVYMSPEQARGLPIDARTDVFSLGVVVYEMVAGRLPFEGLTSSEVMASILSDKEPQPLARYSIEAPAELERIVSKALRKERDQRYQTIKDLMLDLQSLKRQREFEAKLESSRPPESKIQAIGASEASTVSATTQAIRSPTSKIGRLTSPLQLYQRRVIVAAVIILIGVALGYALLSRKAPATATLPEIKSLAVLPLTNLSGDTAQDYFADGMAEEVLTELAKISALRVISRTSTMQYKGTRKTMPEIARELNVDAVIEGSVLRSGDRVRITVQLIHAPTDKHLWADSYERDVRDVLALQSEVARAIASEIKVKLTPQEQVRLASARSVNPAAHEAYLKGRYYSKKATEESLRKSIEYFQRAIDLDPSYALAYAGLADCYDGLGGVLGFLSPQEFYPRAKAAASRALELDETLAEAHFALAENRLLYEWDWAQAEREYQRAIELNANLSEAHQGYGYYLESLGRFDEAVAERKRAAELNPLSASVVADVGYPLYYARRYDEATAHFQKALDLDASFYWSHLWIGQAYVQKGMYEEAIAEIKKAVAASGGDTRAIATLGHAYAASGKRGEAQKVLDELKQRSQRSYVSPYFIALIYAGLGEKDQAFDWLGKAREERHPYLTLVNVEPVFDNLHSDPRFAELLRHIGLPQ